MTTPKELADKAKKLATEPNRYNTLCATIDQLQAMAEARQGSGEPVEDGDYYSEEADDIAKSRARAADEVTDAQVDVIVESIASSVTDVIDMVWHGNEYTGEGKEYPEINRDILRGIITAAMQKDTQ